MVKIAKTASPARFQPRHRRVLVFPGDSAAESSPRVVVRGPFSDQRVGLEDTPSRGKIVKESLCFSLLEPMVLGVIPEVRFFVLKTYFFSVIQKYIF
jgi:hypothetical protein